MLVLGVWRLNSLPTNYSKVFLIRCYLFHFQELQPTGVAAAVVESEDSFLDNLIFNGQATDTSSSTTTTGRTKTPRPRPTSDHELRQGSVTGTPKPPTTELDDLFISVKTTKSYHDSRLSLIIKTWFQLAKSQVSINSVNKLQERGRQWTPLNYYGLLNVDDCYYNNNYHLQVSRVFCLIFFLRRMTSKLRWPTSYNQKFRIFAILLRNHLILIINKLWMAESYKIRLVGGGLLNLLLLARAEHTRKRVGCIGSTIRCVAEEVCVALESVTSSRFFTISARITHQS